ncbi:hypothetical protein Enr13x_26880 [Stieleria neptunia]|uniref:DUF5060 domain-containing protein n=1 Tax=Stieleria neptunia TaxID=2527979 RepID=A0A518HPS4_9BACT|nr:DUF5060 domain-containing protein [Stieleria neptunia]QDV42838.1 hypothetical protein Enr13x_26880 [Stieleria neptunia]
MIPPLPATFRSATFRALVLLAVFNLPSFTSHSMAQETNSIEQWDVYEITLKGSSAGNPYLETSLSVEFSNDSKTVTVPGFYDGDGVYKVRFSPDQKGTWKYVTKSDQDGLSGKSGSVLCVAPTGNNHGPVRVVNTHYLEYATPVRRNALRG